MELNYAQGLIWRLFDMTDMPLAPYLLEVVLKDGRSFYIHSPAGRDEKTMDMVLNVYDFRAIGKEEETIIMSKLQADGWTHLENTYELHPLLEYGRIRINLSDVMYCIEWMKRRWFIETTQVSEDRTPIGFALPL